MDEQQPPDAGREWSRILLICCCVLAAVAVGALVSSFGSGGIAGSPIESALPGEQIYQEHVNPAGSDASGGFGASGQLGALNPGQGTAVGGNIEGTSPFASTNTSTHFVVESSQPAYWRTGAYSEYTGSGWRESGETQPLDGPIGHEGISDEEIAYEVTLERPASAVPTPWRPVSVSSDRDLVVTEEGAVHGAKPFEEGTTFSGVSNQPERDPTLLATSDGKYSSDVSAYTELPGDTPSRVGRFTDDLTADADNPYEAAMAIQDWLRSEKGYSLDVSRRSGNIADTFIFNMERGYCEYFATAMTVMLRTQDIPARYVVGYSTGQRVGEDRYEVMGMNAHAWVEVYFEDFGWVKFDPTPGDSRLAVQQAALEEAGETTVNDTADVGSPGEVFEPGNIREIEDDLATRGDNGTDENNQSSDKSADGAKGYEVSFDPDPVPGETVTVTVTYDGSPAGSRVVTFNGERVGITNSSGMVTGTVPAAEELVVDVSVQNASIDVSTPAAETAATAENSGDFSAGSLSAVGPSPRLATGTLVSPTGGSGADDLAGSATSGADQEHNESSGRFVVPLETNASLVFSGDVLPGSKITVTALVDDVPLTHAAITIDGDLYGRTDENGRATVLLPAESGEKTLAVQRDLVSGNTTITIPALDVSVETDLPVALPYGSVTVQAQYGNRTIVGAPVSIDGQQVATTGQDGTASLRLPAATSASIAVSDNGLSTETTVRGMLQHLLLGVLAIVAVAGAVVGSVRRSSAPKALLGVLRRTLGRVLAGITGAIVLLATRRGTYLDRFVQRVRITITYLGGVATGRNSPAETLIALQSWSATWYRAATGVTPPDETGQGAARPDDGVPSVQDAWRDFLEYVSMGDPGNHTPGEIARHAVDSDGLPPEAVATLRDAFRAVEYGSRPGDAHVDKARAALAEIRERLEGQRDATAGGSD